MRTKVGVCVGGGGRAHQHNFSSYVKQHRRASPPIASMAVAWVVDTNRLVLTTSLLMHGGSVDIQQHFSLGKPHDFYRAQNVNLDSSLSVGFLALDCLHRMSSTHGSNLHVTGSTGSLSPLLLSI